MVEVWQERTTRGCRNELQGLLGYNCGLVFPDVDRVYFVVACHRHIAASEGSCDDNSQRGITRMEERTTAQKEEKERKEKSQQSSKPNVDLS